MTETRAQTIERHVRDMLHHTSVSLPSFSTAVVTQYHGSTPAVARGVLFHTDGDTYHCMRANAQIIRRYLEGEPRLPCELEEALVLALPEPWQSRCLSDLAARYGLLAARIPVKGKAPGDIAQLFREAGEAGSAIAQWLEGVSEIGVRETHMAATAEKELHDVIAAATGLLARIERAKQGKDKGKEKACSRAH